MGRIEKALRLARQNLKDDSQASSSIRKKNAQSSVAPAASPATATVDRSILLSKAAKVDLDIDHLYENRVITPAQSPGMRSSYKMLRTRMLQRMRSNNWSKVAITAARSNAGKTLTSINTAISLAQEPNQQIVLVDLDLRNPTVYRYLNIQNKHGLSDYLLGNASIESVVVQPNIDRLLIVPNFLPFENSSEMLSSQAMNQFMQTLDQSFGPSIVLFDMPPLLDADDMLAFSPQVDAVLFVVAQGETRRIDLEQSGELINELDVLGVVLNKSSDHAPSYY